MMKASTQPKSLFALQDCERILASRKDASKQSKVEIEATLLADIVALARQVRAWGG